MKIGRLFKELSRERVVSELKESGGFIVVKFQGLKSPEVSGLRQVLKGVSTKLFVVRNKIAESALKDQGQAELAKLFAGPSGMVALKDNLVDISRALYNYAKEHENLKLIGGFFQERILEKRDIEAMAVLPSKDVLRAQVVILLKQPINRLVFALKYNLRKIVWCLEEIKKKKST